MLAEEIVNVDLPSLGDAQMEILRARVVTISI